MRRRALFSLVTLGLVIGIAVPAQAATESKVTDDDTAGSYQRATGGTDATMTACSIGRRQQNEPTVAVDPTNTAIVVSGSNDYCASIVNNEVWSGYYRSTNGGPDVVAQPGPGLPGRHLCRRRRIAGARNMRRVRRSDAVLRR